MNNSKAIHKASIRLAILCFAIFIISILSVIETGMNAYKGIAIAVSLIIIAIFAVFSIKYKKQKKLQQHRRISEKRW